MGELEPAGTESELIGKLDCCRLRGKYRHWHVRKRFYAILDSLEPGLCFSGKSPDFEPGSE